MSEIIKTNLKSKLYGIDFALEGLKNKRDSIDKNIGFLQELRIIIYVQIERENE